MDRRLAVAIGVSPAKKKAKGFYPDRVPDTPPNIIPPPPSTSPPAVGTVYYGFSQDNVAAVTAMRERMAKLPTPKVSTPLHTAEQQQLMLQFRWDKDFTCLHPVSSSTRKAMPKTGKASTN